MGIKSPTTVVGRVVDGGFLSLGTAFPVGKGKKGTLFATAFHVIGPSDQNIALCAPNINALDDYQYDHPDTFIVYRASVKAVDSFRDTAILECEDIHFDGLLPRMASTDEVLVGDLVVTFGFPQCTRGRHVMTFQQGNIGAKALRITSGVKVKHCIWNVQARPGQSGAPLLKADGSAIVAMLVGAWIPKGSGASIGGVNPEELHQTTYCVSAEYLTRML